MADRADWDLATRQQRHLAVAADAELRRHADQKFPPLRSAEPPPATQAQHDELILAAGEEIREISPWIAELAARRSEFTIRLSERRSLLLPAEDPDYADFGGPSPPGHPQKQTPSSNRLSLKSSRRHGSWNASRAP
jgi:hypothetical protein